ncbi:MAG: erythromycin biosynthesis sensory transduction protein eryC1 [Bacteroidetes bacterium GWE2_29_8]|nr:MAG: erythromycin biosynthesis sensory transduction protein eryC1 [Bacteroidetes bacterium GWE2_29_8]OFY24685.1 MAG: erythromycin biosynthesis sensory transduction protein eryC1 [Bacteroidetes bacterium GWF2_29_10]
MNVPFVDLKKQYQSIKTEIDNAIQNVIENTAFIGGKAVKEFEQNFANTYKVKHCISTANGTDAIYIVMKMLGIGEGDEVITTAHSWISTSETISQTGAKVVFVDTENDYFTIDADKIEQKITSKTKAIIPVHLYGQAAQMDKIVNICKKYNIALIEDCAQSHFSEFKGQYVGTFGIASTFSFYPGKNMGAYGDAGCILTNDDTLADKFRMYANHGALVKHQHVIEGINSRLDGLQAAILNVKLKHIFEWNNKRILNAQKYNKALGNIKQVITPLIRPESKHTSHVYCIKVEKREQLIEYLKTKGIDTAIHYPTILPFLKAYNYLGYSKNDFPVAYAYQDKILSLPMFPELTDQQIEYIAQTIKDFYNL